MGPSRNQIAKYALIVQLDEPDESGAWQQVLSPGPKFA